MHLYSPDFKYYIHEDDSNKFHIYDDNKNKVCAISEHIKTLVDGRKHSLGVSEHMRILEYMASKVKWEERQYFKKSNKTLESKLQLRFLTHENRDICYGRIRHGRLEFLN